MKAFKVFLVGLISTLFLFSCDEGEGFEYTVESVRKDYSYIYTFAQVGDTILKDKLYSRDAAPISLYNILDEEAANLLKKATFIDCSMQIAGLKDLDSIYSVDNALNNFTLKLKYERLKEEKTYQFGNFKVTPVNSNDVKTDIALNYTKLTALENFTEQLLDYFDHSNKTPPLEILFTPTEDIIPAENAKTKEELRLIMTISATYQYLKVK